MADLCDRAYLIIDGNEIECDSIDCETDPATEPRETMNRKNRASGYKRGVPKFNLSCEFPVDFDVEDLKSDLEQKALRGETFEAYVEIESQGGVSSVHGYLDCMIKTDKISAKTGDGVNRSIEFVALDKIVS